MKNMLIAGAVAVCCAAPARATEPVLIFRGGDHFAEAEAAVSQADTWRRWAEDFSRDMRASMGTMFGPSALSAKVVTHAPYSAEVITESNQPLADGNVISRKTSGAVYRDAQGRTRQESGGDGKERSIYISDPVEGKSIILSPGSKHAVVQPRKSWTMHATDRKVVVLGDREIRIQDGKVFIDGKELSAIKAELDIDGKKIRIERGRIFIDGKEFTPGEGGRKVVVKTLENDAGGEGSRREEVRIQIVRSGDGAMHDFVMPAPPAPPAPPGAPRPGLAPLPPLPPAPALPGASTLRFESIARLGKGVTTSLGSKDFDGVRAEGKSTEWTIPAGKIGNRNPIKVTSESWYSPELQLTVYSRYNDPRQGESIYRLASIKRAEPAPELFRVPEGYEEKTRGNRERREARG